MSHRRPRPQCVRFRVEDVVRSAAAAESVEILAHMQADEAASGSLHTADARRRLRGAGTSYRRYGTLCMRCTNY